MQLSNETMSLITHDLDKLLDEIVESIHTSLCEQMSPNDIEFNSQMDKTLDLATEYLHKFIDGEELDD